MTPAEQQEWWVRARYLRRTLLVLPVLQRDTDAAEHQPANDTEPEDVDAA